MAKKPAATGKQPQQPAAPPADQPAAADVLGEPVALVPRTPAPKVNNANLAELKHALDDQVNEFFAEPAHRFTRSFRHDDVRLSLGWTSVAVAAATGYYGYRTEFHDSKFWVSVGVLLYVALNTVLALYVAFVEKNVIFVGKRRTFASRISTERLTISSLAASSPRTYTASTWVPFPLSLLAPSPIVPAPTTPGASYPLYALTLSYSHSSNAGKALLHQAEQQLVRPCAQLFDAEGRLARGEVVKWLEQGLEEVQGGGPADGPPLTMRRGQRQNAITNSPVVRSFIRPVLTAVPSAASLGQPEQAAQPAILDYTPDETGEPDGQWLIPTQPSSLGTRGGAGPGTSDVKGKKRAREDDIECMTELAATEYDPVGGTRFGVPVCYSEETLPAELDKYWAQRYRLFSLYDEGCEMDREGWFSVTPENIAAQIAERCRSGVIVDAFCGVGGNAIQFAFTCERVIALDTSPVRLACAAHNARIYGVADRITFVLGDWVAWAEAYAARLERREVADADKVEVVFLSPPWGGIEYQTTLSTTAITAAAPPAKKRRTAPEGTEVEAPAAASTVAAAAAAYPLSALAPLPGADLFALARRCTQNVALFLPRNVDLLELATLPGLGPDEKVEIEEEWMGWKCKAVTAYFGELAVGNGYVDETGDQAE
ncbi:hypothetical protein JCM3770_003614 [Rhodotorula araucariae]